jgi:hypothetical protein
MNVEIGTEAAQFPEKGYTDEIFVAVLVHFWNWGEMIRWKRSQEKGGRCQEKGGRSQEKGGRCQEKGGRSQEKGGRSQEKGGRRQEKGGRSQEKGGRRQEKGGRSQEKEGRSQEKGGRGPGRLPGRGGVACVGGRGAIFVALIAHRPETVKHQSIRRSSLLPHLTLLI